MNDAQDKRGVTPPHDINKDDAGKDEIVNTPAGPRRRSQVHHVEPGESVRRNDDGSYTVVPPSPSPCSDEKE